MYVKINRGTCPEYLTKGKVYKAKRLKEGLEIKDDSGDKTVIFPVNCGHLNGGSWWLLPNHKPSLWQRIFG